MRFTLRLSPLPSLIVLACCLVLLAGCAGLGKKLEPPRINLAHISVQEFKAFETVFELQVRVFNTNDIPLVVKALDCDLEVSGERLATGVTQTETTIPALGSGLLDVTVYASSLQMVARVLDGLGVTGTGRQQESIDYTLSGRLHLGGRALPSRLPFTTTGTLSMDRFSR
jgi:LEA14-like dessication related protein